MSSNEDERFTGVPPPDSSSLPSSSSNKKPTRRKKKKRSTAKKSADSNNSTGPFVAAKDLLATLSISTEDSISVNQEDALGLSISDDEVALDEMQHSANIRTVRRSSSLLPSPKNEDSSLLAEKHSLATRRIPSRVRDERKLSATAFSAAASNHQIKHYEWSDDESYDCDLIDEEIALATRRVPSREVRTKGQDTGATAKDQKTPTKQYVLSDNESNDYELVIEHLQRISGGQHFASHTGADSTFIGAARVRSMKPQSHDTETAINVAPADQAPLAPWNNYFCDESESTFATRGLERAATSQSAQVRHAKAAASDPEAYLVNAEIISSDQPIVVATPETWLRQHQWWLTGGLVVGIVTVVLSVVFSVVDMSPDQQYSPTMAPTTMLQAFMSEASAILVATLPALSTPLLNESSPQYAALQWISERQLANRNEAITNAQLFQLYSLAALFYSTIGSTSWLQSDGWVVEANECTWHGVKCNGNGLVDALLLSDNGLEGTLPADLAILSDHLTAIDLTNNSISGPIPQEYHRLTKLSYFVLKHNMIDASIPSDLFKGLNELKYLDLSGNELQSTIPSSIGELSALQHLILGTNLLIGAIPTEIGRLGQLISLRVEKNFLAASLPSEIGKLTMLRSLQAMNNSILGPIPSEIGLLQSLQVFNIASNSIFNIIPSELGTLGQLTHVDWSHNLFTGTLPSSLNRLTQLKLLRLGNNFLDSFDLRLAGDGFQMFGPMSESLVDLDLSHNFFRDITLPTDFSSLSKLTSLRLDESGLAGDIAQLIGQMTDLERLNLSGLNQGSATPQSLPSAIGLLTKLKEFHMYQSELEGSVPSEISFLTDLELIDFRENGLTGGFLSRTTTLYKNLTNLAVVDLSRNRFTGMIPFALGLLTKLSYLNLASNVLSGPIPSAIGLLQSLDRLLIFDNSLSGSLSSEIGQLSNLVEFDFQSNFLTGSLPSEIGLMVNLTSMVGRLNLDLSGTLASNLGQLSKLKWLHLDDTSISGSLPSELGLMQSLEDIVAFGTAIDGTLPTELGLLANLVTLDLHGVELGETLPSELGQLQWLEDLNLALTSIVGTLPSELGLLTNLVDLNLEDIDITGSLPTEIGLMQSLVYLDLTNTKIIGTLPSELGELESIEKLRLFNAEGISGTLPTELGMWDKMMDFVIRKTGISGTVPTEFAKLSSLHLLVLLESSIVGSIPSEVCERPPPFPYTRKVVIVDCQMILCNCCNCATPPLTIQSAWPSAAPSLSIAPTSSFIPTSILSTFPSDTPTMSVPSTSTSSFLLSMVPTTSLAPTTKTVLSPSPSMAPTTNSSLMSPASSSPTQESACSPFSSIAEVGTRFNITFDDTSALCAYTMIEWYSIDPFKFRYQGQDREVDVRLCPSSGHVWLSNQADFFIQIAVANLAENSICCGNVYEYIGDDVFIISWEGWTIIEEESTIVTFDFQFVLHLNGNIELRWGEGDLPSGTPMSSFINTWSLGFELSIFGTSSGSSWPVNECRTTRPMSDGTYELL